MALIIGNAAYKEAPLRNPTNDARGIARTLRELGFTVLAHENATKRTMEVAILEFSRRLAEGGVGVLLLRRPRPAGRATGRFDGSKGTGTRIDLRPCSLSFVKQ